MILTSTRTSKWWDFIPPPPSGRVNWSLLKWDNQPQPGSYTTGSAECHDDWKKFRHWNEHILPETNNEFIPENWWLEDGISFWGPAYFQGRAVSFRYPNVSPWILLPKTWRLKSIHATKNWNLIHVRNKCKINITNESKCQQWCVQLP